MDKLINIPFSLDWAALAENLHLDEEDAEDFRPYFDEAMRVANPKAAFTCAEIQMGVGNEVILNGMRFESPLLAKNLQGHSKTYPFVITAGAELYELAQKQDDPIVRYWLDATAEAVLREVTGPAFESIRQTYQTDAKYTMNPGSLPQWPISNQRPLFDLLGDVEGEIGVRLTPSMLMLPSKSISGLLFEAEEEYVNCSLCTKLNCPSRRAPYHG